VISLNSFKIGRGDLVSLIGSGGKTTLMYKLAREAVHLGMKVVSTTTTHIFVPAPDQTEKFILLNRGNGRIGVRGSGSTGPTSSAPLHAYAPSLTRLGELLNRYHHVTVARDYAEENKVRGLRPELLCKLHTLNLADLILVEADGSRQKPFKAPKDQEPVIPACSTHCILVVNLDVIGKPLDEKYVHRSQIVSTIAGLSLGDIVTPPVICSVINSPKTYRNKIPPDAETVLFLNGVNSSQRRAWAESIQAGVDRGLIHKVVWGDLFNWKQGLETGLESGDE